VSSYGVCSTSGMCSLSYIAASHLPFWLRDHARDHEPVPIKYRSVFQVIREDHLCSECKHPLLDDSAIGDVRGTPNRLAAVLSCIRLLVARGELRS